MPRVFVVDDSAADRCLAVGVLRKLPDADIWDFRDGFALLEQLSGTRADAVLSDISMPEMDGFQVLAEVQRRHPELPVILMSGAGNDEWASQAFELSAAGYVAKRNLSRDLPETLERVLAKTARERLRSLVEQCVSERELTFQLENDAGLLVSLATQLREAVRSQWQCDEVHILRIGMALEEALINAAYHGNLELSSAMRDEDDELYRQTARERARQTPFAQRKVQVQFQCGPRSFRCVIRDEGPGFDPDSLPDPFSEESMSRPSGRGLTLIRTFMDEVRFNELGNEITLMKRRPPLSQRAFDNGKLLKIGR